MRLIDLSASETSLKIAVENAVQILKEGGLVIVPTETAYGLVADTENQKALADLFRIKERSHDKPSAIFVRSAEDLKRYGVELDMKCLTNIKRLWPGPVTFVIKSSIASWPGILSKDGKIGFRCSSHPLIMHLLDSCKMTLTATSANISGIKIDGLDKLKNTFSDKADLFIVDPGLDFHSLPSTVVELDEGTPKILREGRTPPALIEEAFANA